MSRPGQSDEPPVQDDAPPVVLDPRAEALLRRLLRLDAAQVGQIRSALPPRRRPPGMAGPSADLGEDPDAPERA